MVLGRALSAWINCEAMLTESPACSAGGRAPLTSILVRFPARRWGYGRSHGWRIGHSECERRAQTRRIERRRGFASVRGFVRARGRTPQPGKPALRETQRMSGWRCASRSETWQRDMSGWLTGEPRRCEADPDRERQLLEVRADNEGCGLHGNGQLAIFRRTQHAEQRAQPSAERDPARGRAGIDSPPYQENHEEGNATPAKVCRTQSAR